MDRDQLTRRVDVRLAYIESSRADLATALGVTRQAVYQWLSAPDGPTSEQRGRLSVALGVSRGYLEEDATPAWWAFLAPWPAWATTHRPNDKRKGQ